MNNKKILGSFVALVVGSSFALTPNLNQTKKAQYNDNWDVKDHKDIQSNLEYNKKNNKDLFEETKTSSSKISFDQWLKTSFGHHSYEQWKNNQGHKTLGLSFQKSSSYQTHLDKNFEKFWDQKHSGQEEKHVIGQRQGPQARTNPILSTTFAQFRASAAYRNAVLNFDQTKDIVEYDYEKTSEFARDNRKFLEDNNLLTAFWQNMNSAMRQSLKNSKTRVLPKLYEYWYNSVFAFNNKSSLYKRISGDLKYSYYQVAENGWERSSQAQNLLRAYQTNTYRTYAVADFVNDQYETKKTNWWGPYTWYYGFWYKKLDATSKHNYNLGEDIGPKLSHHHVYQVRNRSYHKKFAYQDYQNKYNEYVATVPQALKDVYDSTNDYQTKFAEFKKQETYANWRKTLAARNLYTSWYQNATSHQQVVDEFAKTPYFKLQLNIWKQKQHKNGGEALHKWYEKRYLRYTPYMTHLFKRNHYNNPESKYYQNKKALSWYISWMGSLSYKDPQKYSELITEHFYKPRFLQSDEFKKILNRWKWRNRYRLFKESTETKRAFNTWKLNNYSQNGFKVSDSFNQALMNYYLTNQEGRTAGKTIYANSPQVRTDITNSANQLALKKWRETEGYRNAYQEWAKTFANGKGAWLDSKYFTWLHNNLVGIESKAIKQDSHWGEISRKLFRDQEILGFKSAPKGNTFWNVPWYGDANRLKVSPWLRTMKQLVYTGSTQYETKFNAYKNGLTLKGEWTIPYEGSSQYQRDFAAFFAASTGGRSRGEALGRRDNLDVLTSKQKAKKTYAQEFGTTLDYQKALNQWIKEENRGLELFKKSAYARGEYQKYQSKK